VKGKRKGWGREREGKGKGKGRERDREGKGKEKGREREREREGEGISFISAVSVRFESVSKYRNKPNEVIIFFRKKYRNRQCFGLFRFEPKEKKSVSQDTLLKTSKK
jgi:hypothetical protein